MKTRPKKIVQFGEGNFLRAFADNFIDEMNEKAEDTPPSAFPAKLTLFLHERWKLGFKGLISLFTTGRGTPFGAPAPTVKISTNTALFEKKNNWIDFNAGSVAEGEDLDAAGERLLDYVLRVASGERTKAEAHGAKEIAIFKDGVTL